MVLLHIKLNRITQLATCQQIFVRRPPRPITTQGIKRSKCISDNAHVAYQFKGNHKCSSMVAFIFACRPSPPQVCGWGRNSTYSVHGHIAYQTKGNSDCSYVVANICPSASPQPLTWGFGSLGQSSTFSEHGPVAYQIK